MSQDVHRQIEKGDSRSCFLKPRTDSNCQYGSKQYFYGALNTLPSAQQCTSKFVCTKWPVYHKIAKHYSEVVKRPSFRAAMFRTALMISNVKCSGQIKDMGESFVYGTRVFTVSSLYTHCFSFKTRLRYSDKQSGISKNGLIQHRV